MARKFKYNENVYDDPGADFGIEDVKTHLSQFFPELSQATYTEKTLEDGTVEITFAKKVGVKGSSMDTQFQTAFILRPRRIPHRYRMEGLIEWGNGCTGEIDTIVEAHNPDTAQQIALNEFSCKSNVSGVDWVSDEPPDVEDLGELPMDVWMRRIGQPELPGVPV